MNEQQYDHLIEALYVMNTGIRQLLDANMMLIPANQREIIDLVHNKYNKFLSDDTWVDDYYDEHGYLPEL